jgi:hypothetical protein
LAMTMKALNRKFSIFPSLKSWATSGNRTGVVFFIPYESRASRICGGRHQIDKIWSVVDKFSRRVTPLGLVPESSVAYFVIRVFFLFIFNLFCKMMFSSPCITWTVMALFIKWDEVFKLKCFLQRKKQMWHTYVYLSAEM